VHTLIETEAGSYAIGSWQIGVQGYAKFDTLFSVRRFQDAIVCVNYLNGGANDPVVATQINAWRQKGEG
jgi:hypothetical protein